ncbi:MAG: SPOR domain-containing protein [Cyclonatronaceae bacterium]
MDKISHVQFVEILASKLGLTDEETAKKLTELILGIKKEAVSGEMVIDGLGTFTTKNKELTFVPDESFELEINHNYAGMIPVLIEEPGTQTSATTKKTGDKAEAVDDTVSGAEAEDDADDFEEEEFVDVIDEQDPFDLDDEDEVDSSKEKVTSASGTGTRKSEESTEDTAEKVRRAALEAEEKKIKEEQEAATAGQDTTYSVKSDEEVSATTTGSDEDIQPNWVEPGTETGTGTETAPETAKASGNKSINPENKEVASYDRVRPDSNTGTIIAILVAAIVVVAGALYLFGFLSGSPSATTTPVVSEESISPPAVVDEPESGDAEAGFSEMEQLAEEEAARDVTAQPVTPVEEQAAIPVESRITEDPVSTPSAASFGLRGNMNTSLERPYTIVVHSLASRSDADRESSALAGAGYRSTHFRVELPDGSVRWRVAIGQFGNTNTAMEAATQLPEPYLTNHFISRIESYNP